MDVGVSRMAVGKRGRFPKTLSTATTKPCRPVKLRIGGAGTEKRPDERGRCLGRSEWLDKGYGFTTDKRNIPKTDSLSRAYAKKIIRDGGIPGPGAWSAPILNTRKDL